MFNAIPSRMRKGAALAALAASITLALSGCAGVVDSPSAGMPTQTRVQQTPQPPPTTSDQPTGEPTGQPTAQPTDTPSPTDAPPATPSEPPSATEKPLLARGSTGDKVRELQHRLAQLDWYDGLITPDYGQATEAAVQGFQGKRGLPSTGKVDQKTWDVLVGMTKMPTHDQMYNVLKPGPALMKQGSTGDKVRDLQARLKQIDWYSQLVDGTYGQATVDGVKGFQAKRAIPVTGEVDQRTLDRLYDMTHKPTAEELTNKPPKQNAGKVDPRCLTGRAICIDKSTNQLRWVVDGSVKQTLAVRFGSELTPTREGSFTLYWKSRHHVSTIYNTPMPWAMFFSGGQAVHYSADFAARGYNGASHGCVNVRDKAGIAWLYDQTREGDKVIVYRS
ncbi:peptidoglycan-binding protein [Propionibacteriaceae bacterium G57]|uniref:peptidoglycan-binding protein n=1 Tax=Aestuariimicrobium sp. G57 TaxID=3418485 RepID=UPI003DA6DA50